MKLRTTTLLLISILLLNCSDKKKEAELNNRISELEAKIENCMNGAEKLHSKMLLAYDDKLLDSCKIIYKKMVKLHPENLLFKDVKKIYDDILTKEENEKLAQKRLAEKKEKDRIRKIKAEKAKRLAALKILKKRYDDVADISWYNQPYFTHYNNRNLTSIYMGANGKEGLNPWLRITMSYTGDDWIFFKSAFLSYDGKTLEIPFDDYRDKKTENRGGSVWEWIDVTVSSSTESFLREFAKSKTAKMRLSGKYTKTRKLTYNERRGITAVLDGYDALKSN